MAKKITKKQLKEPDEFLTLTQRAYRFAADHLREIVIGIGLCIFVVGSVFLYQWWQKQKEEKASQELGAALAIYQQVSSPFREGSPQEFQLLTAKFDEVAKNFPGTPSGRLSLLYKGTLHLRTKEFDEAIQAYQAFLDKGGKEGLYRFVALDGLGYAYEGKKDFEKALQAHQKILDLGSGLPMADVYLNIGRCYEKLGKSKEAVENYQAFLKASPRSPMANLALREISRLQ